MLYLSNIRDAERGQGLVEYALIIALVAIAVLVGMGLLGTNLDAAFNALAVWVQTNITAAL